jgi:hypothetical protein
MRPLSTKVEPIRERATFPELFNDVKILQDDSRTPPISTLSDFIEFSEIAEQLLENDLKPHITETPRCFEVYGEAEYQVCGSGECNFDGEYDYSDRVIVNTAHCQEVNDDDADRIFN